MFKNRINRSTPKRTPNSHPQCFIRRSELGLDPRVAYVESVCATLIESRFGPGRVDPVVIDLSNRPEVEPAVFYDLCDDGEMVPCYSLSPQGRTRRRRYLRSNKFSGTQVFSVAALTPNQGRGSP